MSKIIFALLFVFTVASCQPVSENQKIDYVNQARALGDTREKKLPENQETTTSTKTKPQSTEQLSMVPTTFVDLFNRLGEAASLTIQEESNSIVNTVNSIGQAADGSIKAGFNALQTGFDLFLLVPKFGKNVFVANAAKN